MVARASRLRSFGLPQKPQAGRSRHHGKASFETHSYLAAFNRYGIVPQLGLFLNEISDEGEDVKAMRRLAAAGTAEFATHAF